MEARSPWPKYAKTIPEMFFERVSLWSDDVLFCYKQDNNWVDVTWKEAERLVLEIAAGLVAEGMAPNCAVAMLSNNRVEWSLIDMALLSAGALDVPLYPTSTAEQISYILEDSGSEIIFVEDQEQLNKVLQIKDQLPKLRRIVVIAPCSEENDVITDLNALMEKGRGSLDRKAIDKRWQEKDPEDVATLIYTSGTTGNPKGVMLSHRNLYSNADGVRYALKIEPGTKDLQFLPLCHSFGRTEVYGLMMHQGIICYAESIEKIPDNFKEVQPDVFITVPRLLEKVHTKIMAGLESASAVKKGIFKWALGTGRQVLEARMEKRAVSKGLAFKFKIADKLVFSKIKEALGGKLKYMIYGAAPLAFEIEDFFASTGIYLLGGYGLSETSPVLTGNTPDNFRIGSVGLPWPDTEIKIADDGEIMARGPQIMKGYWNNPEATQAAIDEEGWFFTGDIGEIDTNGFLKITDRKKDIIITAGGKNVAPQNIENLLKMDEAIEQVAVIGDRRKFLVALVVPSFEWLDTFARDKGLSGDRQALITMAPVKEEYERRIAEKNSQLAQYETIKRFELLAEEFTVENDLFTPTMKVKRKNLMKAFNDLIEAMYIE